MNSELSVIIPNYNKEKYIQECIESIEKQTIIPEEIIVIDDASTDSSREIVFKMKEKYDNIRLISFNNNKGVSHARNIGIYEARTKYVTFIDSDDYYINTKKLENELRLIKQHPHCISFSKIYYVSCNGESLLQEETRIVEGNMLLPWMKGSGRVAVARDYCIEKDVILNVGAYQEDCNFYEDLDLLLRLAKKNLFYCTHEYGTAYRQNVGGLSEASIVKHEKAKREIRERYIHDLDRMNRMKVKTFWILQDMKREIRSRR